jgi:rubrerythrin
MPAIYPVAYMADFIDDEILEMAVAREVDAYRFYLALVERVENRRIRKVFEMLAAEELEHKAKIELEIMKTGRVVKEDKPPAGFHDQQPDYAPTVIDMNYKDVLLMGMQKEEASIRLYVDMAEMTSDVHSKKILLALAQEEAGHKLRFQTVLDYLSKGA